MPQPRRQVAPLLDDAGIDRLRSALAQFTVDAVHDALGVVGTAALDRGDLRGARRELAGDSPLRTSVLLWTLGEVVSEKDARTALGPLTLEEAEAAGLVTTSGGEARALLDIRPYAEAGEGTAPWWVVSDFGSDLRPGPLRPDHVLGIGAASVSLAQATIRMPVDRALDIGTGCGIQALHLARHAGEVVATDISLRALRMAATTAALSAMAWDLREGSLLDPVDGETFGLVVANPPFVVSAGLSATDGGYEYRDSGFAGDGVSAALMSTVHRALAPGGVAQLLANWIVPADGSWEERLYGWLAVSGCDAWVWQREIASPGEYVSLWLRDAGEQPGTPGWAQRYDAWVEWFDQHDVAGVGMGLVSMWQTDATPVIEIEDVRQPVEQPVGEHIARWIERRRWLARTTDDRLAAATLRATDGLVLERMSVLEVGEGWDPRLLRLRQSHGMRWEIGVDDAVSALIAGCDGTADLRLVGGLVAAAHGLVEGETIAALLPVVRDLIARGYLEPVAP
jgi:methylase of polypeptide subunit release factors